MPSRALLGTYTAEEREHPPLFCLSNPRWLHFIIRTCPASCLWLQKRLGILVCVPQGPRHKEFHRQERGSPPGTGNHSAQWLPRVRGPGPLLSWVPSGWRAPKLTSQSRCYWVTLLQTWSPGSPECQGTGWGAGAGSVHGIKVALRPRSQEGSPLALPVTFSPNTLLKTDHWFSRSGPGPASASLGNVLETHPNLGASKLGGGRAKQSVA